MSGAPVTSRGIALDDRRGVGLTATSGELVGTGGVIGNGATVALGMVVAVDDSRVGVARDDSVHDVMLTTIKPYRTAKHVK